MQIRIKMFFYFLFRKSLNTFVISCSKNMKVMSRYWFGFSCFIHQVPIDKPVPSSSCSIGSWKNKNSVYRAYSYEFASFFVNLYSCKSATIYVVTLTLYSSRLFRKNTTTIFLMTFPSNSGGTKYTLLNC